MAHQESFRSWQSRSIEQKQTASALLLGLSGATLGFAITQLNGKSAYIGLLPSVAFHLTAIAHVLSVTAGVAFSLNRIRDFDLTSQIARLRESDRTAPSLKEMRDKVRRWGRITRRLFVAQSVSFVAGMVCFLWFVVTQYGDVLYAACD